MGVKNIRLTQIDGKLPNLALMRLSQYFKNQGHNVHFTYSAERELFEPEYDLVFGSAIFDFTKKKQQLFLNEFPEAVLGGTGSGNNITLEDVFPDISIEQDYEIYPDFKPSIGFLQRGCRLKCKFCVVPEKEGAPKQYSTVEQLYRGEPHPKHLHILDNDFFGVPGWEQHIEDIVSGQFKVCLTQGINVRMITDEAADALSRIDYRDSNFKRKRIYTAWDNLGHEKIFFKGVERLIKYGVSPRQIMAYMLIGYDPKETWDAIFYRFNKMVELGIEPYPMPFDQTRKDLKRFQRWVIRQYYKFIPFEEYTTSKKDHRFVNRSIEAVQIL